jgi:flagellin
LDLNTGKGVAAAKAEDVETSTLSDINVMTQEGAQRAIGLSDAAIGDIDKVRSNLGSVQNQLNSAIAGIATARVNISASASTIEDIDFAQEAHNLQKMQILAEAGQFALSNSSDRLSNLITLLTQTDQR